MSTKDSRKPRPSVRIRLALPGDAESLQSLVDASYRGKGGWTTDAHTVVGTPRLTIEEAKMLLGDPKTEEIEPVFVAELDEADGEGRRLVGCVQPSRGKGGSRRCISQADEELGLRSKGELESRGEVTATNETHEEAISPPPPTPDYTAPGSTAILDLFAVHPSYQSSGIGSLLVLHALNHIRTIWKCKTCVIWVFENRPELLAWYEKLGFVWTGERRPFPFPEYLKENVDLRVLEMKL